MHIFLILNYNNSEYSINLINQLIPLQQPIVIVDNHSLLKDYQRLEKYVQQYTNVYLIKTDINLGFSGGNNFGYEFIKNNFHTFDAIHCLNNDIEILDIKHLITNTNQYLDKGVILAPFVKTNGHLATPIAIRNIKTLKQDILKEIKIYQQKIIKHKIARLYKSFYHHYLQKHQSFVINKDYDFINHSLNSDEYFVYNGCYLIFTKKYFDYFDYLFCEKTFLYYEEDFLFYRLFKQQLKTYFIKNVVVNHLENVDSRKDIVKKYQFLLQSAQTFLKELNE